MPQPIKYICSCCGKEQEEWPALTYHSPLPYDSLSEADKKKLGVLGADFCIITHPEQTDRFIRCTLTQKVNDHCQGLDYGLWVSLSEKSYTDYTTNFNNDNHEATYFGWLSNDLPEYEFKESIPTSVYARGRKQRPEIIPHEGFDHPFVNDYYNGITKQEAEKRIRAMLEMVSQRKNNAVGEKHWWKFW